MCILYMHARGLKSGTTCTIILRLLLLLLLLLPLLWLLLASSQRHGSCVQEWLCVCVCACVWFFLHHRSNRSFGWQWFSDLFLLHTVRHRLLLLFCCCCFLWTLILSFVSGLFLCFSWETYEFRKYSKYVCMREIVYMGEMNERDGFVSKCIL